MSDLQVTISDEIQSIYHHVDVESANAVIAALSADPETIGELETAVGRFWKPSAERRYFDGWTVGVPSEPSERRLAIDLSGRLICTGHNSLNNDLSAHVRYFDSVAFVDTWIPYHLADDWEFVTVESNWDALVHQRRAVRSANPPLESRLVLYGKVAGFIAEQAIAAFECDLELPPTTGAFDHQSYATISDVHARWLTTPRDDLLGQTPRDVMLEQHEFLSQDMDDRQRQWSELDECPPGLAQHSAAFQFGGFGTHEIVIYYDLVRYLLWSCWDHLKTLPAESLGTIDISAEADRLARFQQDWLNTPQNDELCGKSPIYVIHRERARTPLVVPRESLMIDCDCPLCRLMADSPGPTFWHLDGCHMDEEFAFSFYQTKDEWELERQAWSDFKDTPR